MTCEQAWVLSGRVCGLSRAIELLSLYVPASDPKREAAMNAVSELLVEQSDAVEAALEAMGPSYSRPAPLVVKVA